jgi:hypothetical protein
MTKRGTIAVALMLLAMLALCAPTAMALQPLSAKQAKKLARDLGKKQKRENDVVVFHVENMKRVDAFGVNFSYDERTDYKTFCTAVLKVRKTQAGSTISVTARLARHRCKAIPADALAIERASLKAARRVRANDKATLRSVRPVLRSAKRCEDLKVPKNRRAAVQAVYDYAFTGALVRPNAAALDSFVAALGRVKSSNDVVVRSVEGWADLVDVLESGPTIKDPCATLKTWANADWSADEAPVDVDESRALTRRGRADSKAINAGARYLVRSGVFRKAALAFTPGGLIYRFAAG